MSVTEPDSYAKILRKMLDGLEGDNALGMVVSGLDFWKVAPEGAAGSFSSSAGRRVLFGKMRGMLPEVEII